MNENIRAGPWKHTWEAIAGSLYSETGSFERGTKRQTCESVKILQKDKTENERLKKTKKIKGREKKKKPCQNKHHHPRSGQLDPLYPAAPLSTIHSCKTLNLISGINMKSRLMKFACLFTFLLLLLRRQMCARQSSAKHNIYPGESHKCNSLGQTDVLVIALDKGSPCRDLERLRYCPQRTRWRTASQLLPPPTLVC